MHYHRQKGFTLVELIICIAILSLLLSLFGTVIGGCVGCFPNYSNGARSGVVIKFSEKGLIWKSFEGELGLGTAGSDEGGAAVMQMWNFSARDTAVIEDLERARDTGKRVSLRYHQYLVKPMTIDTQYVVTDVIFADEVKKNRKRPFQGIQESPGAAAQPLKTDPSLKFEEDK